MNYTTPRILFCFDKSRRNKELETGRKRKKKYAHLTLRNVFLQKKKKQTKYYQLNQGSFVLFYILSIYFKKQITDLNETAFDFIIYYR